jgi:hypothetical protein
MCNTDYIVIVHRGVVSQSLYTTYVQLIPVYIVKDLSFCALWNDAFVLKRYETMQNMVGSSLIGWLKHSKIRFGHFCLLYMYKIYEIISVTFFQNLGAINVLGFKWEAPCWLYGWKYEPWHDTIWHVLHMLIYCIFFLKSFKQIAIFN